MITGIWEFIKELWKDQPLWNNLASLAAVFAALYGFLHFLSKGIKWLFQLFNRESLHHLLKPYFSRDEILRAIGNYIPTQCQNMDPAAEAEPSRVFAFATRERLIPFFIKKVFREKKEGKYYLVLADSGMGKTTFMINLYLKYLRKRFKKYHIVLVPLGHPKADEKIEAVENKTQTILLLDAFDEDIRAAGEYKKRMQEIIDKTLDFQTIIITSRTQFFPSDQDIPRETGIYRFGGLKGEHRFYLVYISPFSRKEINRYLRRKYPFYQWLTRRKARTIVEKSPDLMVRPMLLANIQDLLERWKPYQHTFEIYEEMVDRWIRRERLKDKSELRKFSEVVARDMYENQQTRGGLYIDHDEIGQFATKHHIRLEELEMRSRSLLNRNAEGKYKFAHKSILEYFLSLELIRDLTFRWVFNFDKMEQTRQFYYEQIVIPFFSSLERGYFRMFAKEGTSPTTGTAWKHIKELDLNELENIACLDIHNNQISDITALIELKNVHELKLYMNQITDITPLQELKNIRELRLHINGITDLTPLRQLKNIQSLYLSDNRIINLSPLKELKNIHTLDLGSNQISDLTPLKELNNIQILYLFNNQISDLTTLKELTGLKELSLFNNPIKDKDTIEELRKILGDNLSI